MRDYEQYAPSPKNDKRGCLCDDGTYSTKCCDGSFQAQGIGNITGSQTIPQAGDYSYHVQRCNHNQKKHVHGSTELVIGNVYYFDLVHDGHDGCYTVLSQDQTASGFLWNSVTPYNDCDACIAAN